MLAFGAGDALRQSNAAVQKRTEAYGSRRLTRMASIKADEVRIPRRVREAVSRHEPVVVLNRERPVLAIVHPDEVMEGGTVRRGRPVREIAAGLAGAPAPDPDFVKDMDAVLGSVGDMPEDPWERS